MSRLPPSANFFPSTSLCRSCAHDPFRTPRKRDSLQPVAYAPRSASVAAAREYLYFRAGNLRRGRAATDADRGARSEEHTSELQSRLHLVCRLLLEKKNNIYH